MTLSFLSASGIAMLLTTIGLSSIGLIQSAPTQPVSTEANSIAQSVRITDSITEVTGGNGTSIRIINRRGPRRLYQQQQQRSVYSRSARQDESHTLTIETTGRSLNAELKINGQTVKTLANLSETINLAPYLSAGQNTLEISGTYAPASATTQISLTGPGTQISQQVSGGGALNQTLQISVR